MKIKKLFYVCFIVCISIFLEAKSLEKVTVKLTWNNKFEFAGIYAAKEKGFYKDVGLDVEIIEFKEGFKKDMFFKQLNERKINYSIISSDIFLQKFEGKDIVNLASYSKTSLFSIVTKKNINEPKELKGKKIISSTSLYKTAMWGVLKFAGINKDDITLVQRDYSNDIKQFIQDDSISAISVFNPNQLYELDRLGFEYNIIDPFDYNMLSAGLNLICSKNEALSNPQRALRLTEATNKGWKYAFENKDEIIDLISTKYHSKKSRDALLYEAKKLEKIFMLDLYEIGEILPELIRLNLDTYKRIGLIDKDWKYESLFMDDLLKYDNIYNNIKISLSKEESLYLNNKKYIKMCVDPLWMPLEKIENAKHIGITADYMNILSQKINIPIMLIKTKTWDESIIKAKNKECDIFSLASKSKDRSKYMNFTSPYIDTSIVVATKMGTSFINNIEEILDKKLAVVKGYSIYNDLKKRYPNINLVKVDSIYDGLEKVESGEIFGYLDNSIVTNYHIQKRYIDTIIISGKLQNTIHLSIATRVDEPLLRSIFQKALNSIDSKTQQEILNRWIRIKYVRDIDYRLLKQISIGFFIILFIVTLFLIKQNKLKKSILKQKELFEAMFNSSKDSIAILDMDSNFIKVNQAYCDMTGYTQNELLKISAIKLSTLKDIELTKITIQKAIEIGYIKNFSKNCICKDGRIIDVNITMTLIQNPKRLLINVRDVTELKKTENLLMEKTKEQDTLLSLFDKGEVCLFQWNNDANWSAQYVSKNVSSIFGYTQDEFLNEDILYENIIHQDNLKKVQQEFIDAVYLEVDFFVHSPYKIKTKDNQIKWILDNTLIVKDEDNNVQHLLGYIVNITDLKEYENKLEYKVKKAIIEAKHNEKLLREQSRLAQMGEMLSMIAHQWRQPLGAINSAVIAVQMNIASGRFNNKNDELLVFLEKKHKNINEYVQFLSTTIDDFRNFFKPNKNKEIVDLRLPIQRALRIVTTSMNTKGIKILTTYSDNTNAKIYQNEVMQVILNILKNSEDNFTEKNIKKPKINISTKKEKNKLVILVEDNGGGIDEKILPKIFDPYFSTKLEKNGTGLGLYMSKMIIEEHNKGELNVRNTKDGVCFEIVFS